MTEVWDPIGCPVLGEDTGARPTEGGHRDPTKGGYTGGGGPAWKDLRAMLNGLAMLWSEEISAGTEYGPRIGGRRRGPGGLGSRIGLATAVDGEGNNDGGGVLPSAVVPRKAAARALNEFALGDR